MAKVQESFFLPKEVADAVRPLIDETGVKRKWQIYTAAIIAFLRLDRDAQHTAMSKVFDADLRKDFHRLLLEEGAVKKVVVGDGAAKSSNRRSAQTRRREPDGHQAGH